MRKFNGVAATLLIGGMFVLSGCGDNYGFWKTGLNDAHEWGAVISPDRASTEVGKRSMVVLKNYLESYTADVTVFRNRKYLKEVCDSIAKSKDIDAKDLDELAKIEIKAVQAAVLKNPKTEVKTALMLKDRKGIVGAAVISFLDLRANEICFCDLRQFVASDRRDISRKAQVNVMRGRYFKEEENKADSTGIYVPGKYFEGI